MVVSFLPSIYLSGIKTHFSQNIDLFRNVVGHIRKQYRFHINGWVVLPEHMHCIWTLPDGDDDYAKRWRLIKTLFSKSLPKTERCSWVRQRRGERGIWQRRYWEHTIRDECDYAAHMDYIHFNPVKQGYVDKVIDWPYSTFHHCVAHDIYPENWAGEDIELNVGEPE